MVTGLDAFATRLFLNYVAKETLATAGKWTKFFLMSYFCKSATMSSKVKPTAEPCNGLTGLTYAGGLRIGHNPKLRESP